MEHGLRVSMAQVTSPVTAQGEQGTAVLVVNMAVEGVTCAVHN